MSFRTGLLPTLLRAPLVRPVVPTKRLFHFLPRQPFTTPTSKPSSRFRPPPLQTLSRAKPAPRSNLRLFTTVGLGLTLLYSTLPSRLLRCDTATIAQHPQVGGGNPPPESILSVYELGFGTVCGICTGVFIKKGLRAIAFLLGGVFVLLQYLSSRSFISVDWARMAGRYDSVFGTKTAEGQIKAPTVGGVWAWFVDFVTANFQRLFSLSLTSDQNGRVSSPV